MTYFGVSKETTNTCYMPTFKIKGQVYHKIGALHPNLFRFILWDLKSNARHAAKYSMTTTKK